MWEKGVCVSVCGFEGGVVPLATWPGSACHAVSLAECVSICKWGPRQPSNISISVHLHNINFCPWKSRTRERKRKDLKNWGLKGTSEYLTRAKKKKTGAGGSLFLRTHHQMKSHSQMCLWTLRVLVRVNEVDTAHTDWLKCTAKTFLCFPREVLKLGVTAEREMP